jgi:hypothetical protein
MRPILNLRIALAVFTLVVAPAIAPPRQANPDALYAAAHAQNLSVNGSAKTVTLTPTKYSATPGFQSLAAGGTNYDWAKLVLLAGGWQMSSNNVTVILRWMRQENGTNDWWNRNNPLNNSYGAPGAGGTGHYANLIIAAQKVAAALHAGAGGGYSGIVSALAASSSPSVTAQAIWASFWSTSHYANGTHWSTAPVPVVKAPAGDW